MKLKKRTAILVIHGIGQQLPFETLDGFARGFIETLNENGDSSYGYAHRTRLIKEGDDQWCESYIRVNDKHSGIYIDMHEYYWANVTENQISPSEVTKWLKTTLSGAKKATGERMAS